MQLRTEVLENAFARLEPLAEHHREAFKAATSSDDAAWQFLLRGWARSEFDTEWRRFLSEQAAGRVMPYIVLVDGACNGITAYLDPDERHSTVEIGNTWYHPDLRGGALNPAVKRLLLAHAFDAGARRVQFRVDGSNLRSRAAVLKLGAVEEGTLRRDRITWNGRIRDTVYYSILKEEWPEIREKLDQRLASVEPGPADACTAARDPRD